MNRRTFLKSGSVFAASGMVAHAGIAGLAAGKKVIRVAVVGCGGRGTGGMWKPANAQDFYKFGALGNMLQAAEMLRKEGIDVTVKPVAYRAEVQRRGQYHNTDFWHLNGLLVATGSAKREFLVNSELLCREFGLLQEIVRKRHSRRRRLTRVCLVLSLVERCTGTAGCRGCASALRRCPTRTTSATTG